MAYPIIVLHKGNPPYLRECLYQAKFSNPSSRIILLGDDANKDAHDGAEHFFISDYLGKSDVLRSSYVHLSSHKYEFEFFCLERWFIILDFITKNKIDKFLHIDSDVLLYADFENEPKFMQEVAKVDLALPGVRGTWCNFFQSVTALEKFCDFIIRKYKDRELMQKLQDEFQQKVDTAKKQKRRLRGGGISDMTFITWIRESGEISFLDTFENIVGGLSVQHNIGVEDGCVMQGKIQKITFKNWQPYCQKKNGELIRLASLHLQGKVKRLMNEFATYSGNTKKRHPKFSLKSLWYIYAHGFWRPIRKKIWAWRYNK